jgi:hypothetical protein
MPTGEHCQKKPLIWEIVFKFAFYAGSSGVVYLEEALCWLIWASSELMIQVALFFFSK